MATIENPPARDAVTDEVRERYAATARALLARDPVPGDVAGACCGPTGDTAWGESLYAAADRDQLPGGGGPGEPGLRQPDGRGRAAGRRDRARPRVRRRHRRPAVGDAGRPDRVRLRPGHDRRDARAGPAQRGRGGRHQRRVPQGPHRVDPARRRLGRRRHQQLRREPVGRQGRGPRRDRPRAAARRTDGHQRRRRRRCAEPRASAPSAAASSAASPAPCRSPNIAPGSRRSG